VAGATNVDCKPSCSAPAGCSSISTVRGLTTSASVPSNGRYADAEVAKSARLIHAMETRVSNLTHRACTLGMTQPRSFCSRGLRAEPPNRGRFFLRRARGNEETIKLGHPEGGSCTSDGG